ncbi:MAG: tRNA (guanosine(37)-N1)-methyltransferase TrmD [Parcubacteria group bacterium]|nr:tRNA (guanosine(37)-N1)-methyltransferase TrmD [Parcubacteria group bacterium]
MLQFDILTIFPEMFPGYLNESIIGRAQKKKLVKINQHNFRDYATDKHKTVDDSPYGGGPGMVLKVEPIYRCLQKITRAKKKKRKIILLTPQGKTFDQPMARRLAKLDQLVLICGRYEGFDERVRSLVDEQVSVGDYVLTGGELPAMTIVDAVTRLVPGVVGEEASLVEETFAKKGYIEYPQYTRPEKFKCKIRQQKAEILKTPEILLSGDHRKIKEWRGKQAGKKSCRRK